jgi:DNA-binding MarR family transcriptional regulator
MTYIRSVMGRSSSLLQTEIKKRKPFESAAEEAYLNLLRTTTVLMADFDQLFRQYGVTEQQYNVLRILRGAGEPLPSLEVASRMITRVPDITRLVDRLETAGLVARRRCTEDRRVVYVESPPKAGTYWRSSMGR